MDPRRARERARAHLLVSAEVKRRIAETCLDEILAAAEMIAGALRAEGKVMLCGNGGSAADSQHIAAEFTNRLSADLERPALAALALTTDTSFLTANANDYGFEHVFERQVEAVGREGDVLIGISTSGNSQNVVRAVRFCRGRGIKTIGLLGGDGGQLRALVDLAIVVPSTSPQHVQEGHIAIGHIVCELVERTLFDGERG
ncbi:MAG: SIS domain-containing protein [Chloroflexi bacterium]|nr:SIS domain-containing protein [Chloroflexota bacterium]